MKPPISSISRLVMGLSLLLTLAACDSKKTETTAPTADGAKTQTSNLKELRVGYFANLTHAQAVLGVSSGEFEKAVAPAKLSTKVFNAGPSLIEALFANEIDIGYVGPSPALAAYSKSKGKGIRIIAGSAANGVVIVARKDSGITTLADLAGKKVATPQPGNTQDISAKHYLKFKLNQPDFKNIVPVANAEQAALMTKGEIDASWAPEPWGSLLVAQTGATIIADEKDLWDEGKFAITIVVTTPDFLAAHPDVVEKFLRVHREWTARLSSDPTKYVPQLGDALFALTNKKLPEGVLPSAFGKTLFTEDPLPHTFPIFAQWAVDVGASKEVVDSKGLIDSTILQKLQGEPAASAAPGAAK